MEKKIYIAPVAGIIEMQLPSIMETFSAPEGGGRGDSGGINAEETVGGSWENIWNE